MLYEEDEEEDEDVDEEELSEAQRGGAVGPHGEIYPSSSSSDEDDEGRLYIPRCKLHAYKESEGANLRIRKNNYKFTKGTDPKVKDTMAYLLNDALGCPLFLPMEFDDALVSNNAIEAATYQSDIPLSELMRKETYYKFFQAFTQAVSSEPALIKTEVQLKLRHFDMLYGVRRTKAETERYMRFTQSDFRRFCTLFYVITRRLLRYTEFIMVRERRKRMMPRHILTAAVLLGVIPEAMVAKSDLIADAEVKRLQL